MINQNFGGALPQLGYYVYLFWNYLVCFAFRGDISNPPTPFQIKGSFIFLGLIWVLSWDFVRFFILIFQWYCSIFSCLCPFKRIHFWVNCKNIKLYHFIEHETFITSKVMLTADKCLVSNVKSDIDNCQI